MAVQFVGSSARRARRPRRKPACAEHRLRVLLLEPPGRGRDGRQLKLELDGYEVTAAWEVEAAAPLFDVAFIYLVLSTASDTRRWSWLPDRADLKAPIVVISTRLRADLEADGLRLRERDFIVCTRSPSMH